MNMVMLVGLIGCGELKPEPIEIIVPVKEYIYLKPELSFTKCSNIYMLPTVKVSGDFYLLDRDSFETLIQNVESDRQCIDFMIKQVDAWCSSGNIKCTTN